MAGDLVSRLLAAIDEVEAQTKALYPHLKIVLRLCQAHREIVAMFPVSAPHVDTEGGFYGFQSRDCGEHRTVGPHRAWCYDCSEWCYPGAPCRRCHGISEVINVLARGYDLTEEGK